MSRKRIVIVNGLVVLAFNREPGNAWEAAQGQHCIAQNIFNELWIVVSCFRHILLIFTLQQRIDGRRALLLNQGSKIFYKDAFRAFMESCLRPADGALIMRAIGRNLLAAWA